MNIKPLIAALAFATGAAHAADPVPSSTTPAAPAAQPAPAAAPAATAQAGTVARAQFTSDVRDREPTDNLNTLANDQTRIYFFTELKDLSGQTVTHRWEHNGKVMAEVPIEVGSARWRAFSSKTLDPSWTGEWKVSVVDQSGGTLSASTFTYSPAAAAPAAQPAAPAAAPAPTSR
jgi:hypothetical protein